MGYHFVFTRLTKSEPASISPDRRVIRHLIGIGRAISKCYKKAADCAHGLAGPRRHLENTCLRGPELLTEGFLAPLSETGKREQRKFFTHRRIDFRKFSLPAIKYYTIDKRKELAI